MRKFTQVSENTFNVGGIKNNDSIYVDFVDISMLSHFSNHAAV